MQLDPNTYRLCMLLGVQPGRAAPLLDDAAGGTPQRFLWLPSTDPDAPDVTPPAPPALVLQAEVWPPAERGVFVLPVPPVAAQAIQDARLTTLRNQPEGLNGHALLARLKLAQALTLLDGRRVMTEDDWRLSGVVMEVSDRTRSSVERHLSEEADKANLQRARAEGKRAAVADEAKDEQVIKRISKNIMKCLQDGEEVAASQLRRQLASRNRDRFDEVVALLDATGAITVTATQKGRKMRLSVESD